MELIDFIRCWNVERDELAIICGCSESTVNQWFSQGKSSRPIDQLYKDRLAITHHLWSKMDLEPDFFLQVRQLYNRDRRAKNLPEQQQS